jgi:peptide/nickel transport system permease protein
MAKLRIPAFARTRSGAAGMLLLGLVLLVAVLGPSLAAHSIGETVGAPGQAPFSGAPLGTDSLGRDLLSRVLHGGLSVIWAGGLATALSYLAGMSLGMAAGYSRSALDVVLMRTVDMLLAVPGILLLLLLVSGLGSHTWVVVVGVALVQLPNIARVARTATLEVTTRSYVEAAEIRGEPARSALTREVFPNILPVMLADLGIRFGFAIVAIASINYLGFGLQPPAADWGLMISENQQFISLNAWAVLAPAIMLALLTISVNLVADAYTRSLGTSAGDTDAPVGAAAVAVAAPGRPGPDDSLAAMS